MRWIYNSILLILFIGSVIPLSYGAISPKLYLSNDDVTLSEWGPYSKFDISPSYLSSTKKALLFHFPIIMGAVYPDGRRISNLTKWQPYWCNREYLTTWKTVCTKALPDLSFWESVFYSPDGRFSATSDVVVKGNAVIIEVNFISFTLKGPYFFCDIMATIPEGIENSRAKTYNTIISYRSDILIYQYKEKERRELFIVATDHPHTGGKIAGAGYGKAIREYWANRLKSKEKDEGYGFIECREILPRKPIHFVIIKAKTVREGTIYAKRLLKEADRIIRQALLTYDNFKKNLLHCTKIPSTSITYLISQTLANIIFETHNGLNARIFIPGRNWARAFQWDGGFISMALSEISIDLGTSSIDALFADEKGRNWKPEYMNISPPIHIMALQELYNKTHDINLVKYFLPHAYKSIQIMWHYGDKDRDLLFDWGLRREIYGFSSGMDHLPIWSYVRNQYPFRQVESPDYSALIIRSLKIVATLSIQAKMPNIAQKCIKNASMIAKTMNKYLWDPEKEIFLPVWADNNRKIEGYDKCIISIYPLMSGQEFINRDQAIALIKRLKDPMRYRSMCGIRSVEKDAPYFEPEKPWKGDVWVGPQWLLWKSLLDWGEVELADEISRDILNCFEETYMITGHSMESFNGKTGTPIGKEDFSGLTAPLINLYVAYNRCGMLTGGFDTYIDKIIYHKDKDILETSLKVYYGDLPIGLVAVMGHPFTEYELFMDNKLMGIFRSDKRGVINFRLNPDRNKKVSLLIRVLDR